MNFTISESDNSVKLKVYNELEDKGIELDRSHSAAMKDAITDLIKRKKDVVIDMLHITYFDVSIIKIVYDLGTRLKSSGLRLELISSSP